MLRRIERCVGRQNTLAQGAVDAWVQGVVPDDRRVVAKCWRPVVDAWRTSGYWCDPSMNKTSTVPSDTKRSASCDVRDTTLHKITNAGSLEVLEPERTSVIGILPCRPAWPLDRTVVQPRNQSRIPFPGGHRYAQLSVGDRCQTVCEN